MARICIFSPVSISTALRAASSTATRREISPSRRSSARAKKGELAPRVGSVAPVVPRSRPSGTESRNQGSFRVDPAGLEADPDSPFPQQPRIVVVVLHTVSHPCVYGKAPADPASGVEPHARRSDKGRSGARRLPGVDPDHQRPRLGVAQSVEDRRCATQLFDHAGIGPQAKARQERWSVATLEQGQVSTDQHDLLDGCSGSFRDDGQPRGYGHGDCVLVRPRHAKSSTSQGGR